MLRYFLTCCRAALKFRDYRPQKVTFGSTSRWLSQFDAADQPHAASLLNHIVYLSESETQRILVEQNAALVRRLRDVHEIPLKKLIYVQVHDPGSSSPVMLNLLRDAAGLERYGCQFVDSRDAIGINRATNKYGEGALIYVDDFAGTGNQFCEARDFAVKHVVGSFSEFLLIPSICEEAVFLLGKKGVEPVAGHVHAKAERPLHANCSALEPGAKQRLHVLCQGIRPKMPLGYKDLATMVVLYRNAPNSIPVIFRGSLNQMPFAGIFPRTTDLPKQPL